MNFQNELSLYLRAEALTEELASENWPVPSAAGTTNIHSTEKYEFQPLESLLDFPDETSNRYVEPAYRERCYHFDSQLLDGGFKVPLCHAKASNGDGWARGFYTPEPKKVTCKRCLKSLAKQARPADTSAILHISGTNESSHTLHHVSIIQQSI